MTNEMREHQVTRRKLLDRLHGIRRRVRRLRTQLKAAGPIDNDQRHSVYEQLEQTIAEIQVAIRLLDDARPRRTKE